jgi:hypothetical protein
VAFRTPELERGPAIDHGTSSTGRWLRLHRIRIAIWIAVAEGILILLGAIPRIPAIVLAVIVVALYFWQGRRIRSDTPRHIAWIAAASQALVALVPVLAIVVGTLALILVAFIAVIALILLFTDRG